MRILILLACLALAACSGGGFKGDAPDAGITAAPAPSVAAAPARPSAAPGGGSSASGGSRTAAARAPAEPAESSSDPLIQARVDCWMKVETQHKIRDIDGRIVYVDKCVDALMKGKPAP
jgi:hypothetical protein